MQNYHLLSVLIVVDYVPSKLSFALKNSAIYNRRTFYTPAWLKLLLILSIIMRDVDNNSLLGSDVRRLAIALPISECISLSGSTKNFAYAWKKCRLTEKKCACGIIR